LHKVGVEIVAVWRAWRRCIQPGRTTAIASPMHSRALSGEPLLYKGNDSAQTDIRAA
jgi:hypothetical protein